MELVPGNETQKFVGPQQHTDVALVALHRDGPMLLDGIAEDVAHIRANLAD
jgi:hypothetical protein